MNETCTRPKQKSSENASKGLPGKATRTRTRTSDASWVCLSTQHTHTHLSNLAFFFVPLVMNRPSLVHSLLILSPISQEKKRHRTETVDTRQRQATKRDQETKRAAKDKMTRSNGAIVFSRPPLSLARARSASLPLFVSLVVLVVGCLFIASVSSDVLINFTILIGSFSLSFSWVRLDRAVFF